MISNPGGSRPGSQLWCFAGACVDLVDETFLVRDSSGRAKPLNFIFVARRSLRAVPEPTCLRIGIEMHGRIVGGLLFCPVLRCVNMAAGASGTFHRFGPLSPGRTIRQRWSGYHRRSRVETRMTCVQLVGAKPDG